MAKTSKEKTKTEMEKKIKELELALEKTVRDEAHTQKIKVLELALKEKDMVIQPLRDMIVQNEQKIEKLESATSTEMEKKIKELELALEEKTVRDEAQTQKIKVLELALKEKASLWQTCTYYCHPDTEEVWARQTATDGRPFFCNIVTNEKSWALPGASQCKTEGEEIEPISVLDKPIPSLIHIRQIKRDRLQISTGATRGEQFLRETSEDVQWKARVYFYKPETEEVWLQQLNKDRRVYFCNIVTNALSWKLPGSATDVAHLSGPSQEEMKQEKIDPIEVLVHREHIEQVKLIRKLSSRKKKPRPKSHEGLPNRVYQHVNDGSDTAAIPQSEFPSPSSSSKMESALQDQGRPQSNTLMPPTKEPTPKSRKPVMNKAESADGNPKSPTLKLEPPIPTPRSHHGN